MKKISSKLFVALSGIMALGVSVPAVAQSASGSGSIKIVRPLTVTKDTDMAFGTIIRGAGTVALTAADSTVRSVTGDLGVVGLGQTAAKFTLDGEGAQTVSVNVPATFDMTNSSTSGTLTVTTSKDIGATTTLSSTLGSAGTKVFYIGGSIPITATTASGAYSGTFTVTASYN